MSAVYSTCLMYCAAVVTGRILLVLMRRRATNPIRNKCLEVLHLKTCHNVCTIMFKSNQAIPIVI